MKKTFSEKFNFYALCIILLAGLIFSYSNHFNNPFQFDDDHTIVSNTWIRSLKNIPHFFVDGTTTSSLPQNQSYRPGLTTLNTIDYWIAENDPFNIGFDPAYAENKGLIPFYFHLSIFISFILQAILLFFLFRKILDITFSHKWNKYFALFIVAFYSYHTALAETNNYIISRSDGFSTLMVILALVIYIYFPKKRKYGFFLIPYIFGFMVKETALMFGPILFVYIVLFEKQTDLTKIFSKQNWKKIIASLKAVAITLGIAVLLILLSNALRPKTFTPGIFSPAQYLETQPFVIVQYFKTFILPTELSADTDWKVLGTIFDIRFFMGILFITGMIWLAFRLSRNIALRPVSFGILWFFLALLPTSSIIPLSEVLNDHRVFFPYIGLALSFSVAFIYLIKLTDDEIFSSSSARKIITTLLIAGVLCGHAYGIRQRNKVWSSYETLWYDVTQKSPENGRGLMNYALSQMRKSNYSEAKIYFERALKLSPNYSLLHINLGVLYEALNDNITAEQYYKNAIDLGFYIDQGYFYYGKFLYKQKRYDEAKLMLKNCISTNPAFIDARLSLLELYSETEDWGNLKILAEETMIYLPNDQTCLTYIDAAKNKKTKLDIAVEAAEKDPTAEKYLNLSLKYYEVGLYYECVLACEKAIKIKPDYALAYNNICSAYNQLKLYDKAEEACKKALAIQPDYELAKNNLKVAQNGLNK
jgi:Tfp pilus assembly protein PilF